ncbi:hypothetical protein [Nonomuraea sp. NPDC002799]
MPLLDLLARAGLLDAWLVADLLAASGALGLAGVAAHVVRERIASALLFAVVSAISFAVAVIGGGRLSAWYGTAYAAALILLNRPGLVGDSNGPGAIHGGRRGRRGQAAPSPAGPDRRLDRPIVGPTGVGGLSPAALGTQVPQPSSR